MKHPKVPDLLVLQSWHDGKAKRYQLRQLVAQVTEQGLTMKGED